MKLSVVATLYKSSAFVGEFHRRASDAARALAGDDYEIVLVNDGSPDDSLELAVGIADVDAHVVVVDLSRNFGHHKAMLTGLEHARGDRIFLVDTDLEEEPEWLLPFARAMDDTRCDMVYGVQEVRKGGLFERVSGDLFYRVFNLSSGMDLPRGIVTARLMTRRFVDALLLHREREVFIVGLFHLTGFDQRPFAVKKHGRPGSSYTLRRKISLAVNAVTSFSNAPLIWVFNIGLAISFFAAAYVAYLVFNALFLTRPLVGWTSVIASIWLVGGMIICFIGIVGIYLSKVFTEVKQRPYTIVRRVYGRGAGTTNRGSGNGLPLA
ncbi:glycosyltransferase family 2 protein [Rhodoplanes sp. TEM]|uniref:Glycosyltransferase family 2 protein n=1 Tax=Rhodoplanes tepidamans TaxID=200616 RepID=A0ABT5JDI6_RHOTP|nr:MULTISPECIES: glycosyltransferase family 2 protein [Rhodoplanes]MDC7787416.1 glycosyltransferase family 2 protein [Rhodoplanes tepidamans]MDC7985535.1 glycosyltransferase family 2 protein [Rhodoplanes sp. TEM]MDQ0358098.1 putative glycosyltransferase [Rhodoplanes tepidamans]